jgi:hypothetical protein
LFCGSLEESVFVLDFKHTSRKAFFHGFMKGVAAPVMLYSVQQAPAIPAPEPIRPNVHSPKEALARDWAQVENDMRSVIDSYVEAAS